MISYELLFTYNLTKTDLTTLRARKTHYSSVDMISEPCCNNFNNVHRNTFKCLTKSVAFHDLACQRTK